MTELYPLGHIIIGSAAFELGFSAIAEWLGLPAPNFIQRVKIYTSVLLWSIVL